MKQGVVKFDDSSDEESEWEDHAPIEEQEEEVPLSDGENQDYPEIEEDDVEDEVQNDAELQDLKNKPNAVFPIDQGKKTEKDKQMAENKSTEEEKKNVLNKKPPVPDVGVSLKVSEDMKKSTAKEKSGKSAINHTIDLGTDIKKSLLRKPAGENVFSGTIPTTIKAKASEEVITKRPATHIMVDSAIKALNEASGSSLVAIKRFISSQYPGMDEKRLNVFIKKYLAKSVKDGKFVQKKRSFKFSAQEKNKQIKAQMPTKLKAKHKIEKDKKEKLKSKTTAKKQQQPNVAKTKIIEKKTIAKPGTSAKTSHVEKTTAVTTGKTGKIPKIKLTHPAPVAAEVTKKPLKSKAADIVAEQPQVKKKAVPKVAEKASTTTQQPKMNAKPMPKIAEKKVPAAVEDGAAKRSGRSKKI